MSSRVPALGLALLCCVFMSAAHAAAPVIISGNAADATAGDPFSYQIAATNNPTFYSASPLPAGLAINTQSGLIFGSTTVVGEVDVTLTASNQPPGQQNTTNTGTLVLKLTVLAKAPRITNSLEIRTSLGVPVNFALSATGFPTPGFSVAPLPPGLTLESNVIKGTPLQGGILNATITATNSGPKNSGGTDTKQLLFNITAPPTVTSDLVIPGVVGQPIDYRITGNNNPTAFNLANNPGALPIAGGITIDAAGQQTGILSGTPTQAGRFPAFVFATNTLNGVSDPCTFTVSTGAGRGQVIFAISTVPGAPAVTCTSNANATVATPFSFGITATNAPTSFSITAGALPTGLSLNATTGIISGVPAAATAGVYNLTVRATNAQGFGEASLRITVGPALPFFDLPVGLAAKTVELFEYQVNALSYPPETGITANTFQITDTGGFLAPPNSNGIPSTGSANIRINVTTGKISGTPELGDIGTYTLTVRARNSEGFFDRSFILFITDADVPATAFGITSGNRAVAIEGCAFEFQVVCPGATFFTMSPSPNVPDLNLVINDATGEISGTPGPAASASSPYSLLVRCFESITGPLVGEGTIFLVVLEPPLAPPAPPQIIAPGSTGGVVGALLEFPITTTPDYSDPVTLQTPLIFSGTPLPVGTTLSSDNNRSTALIPGDPQVSIFGIPTEVSVANSAVSVVNATGSDTTTVAFTVSPVQIYSPLTATGMVGEQFLVLTFPNSPGPFPNAPYFIRATGGANQYDATGLPPGLTVNPQTGAIAGIPANTGSAAPVNFNVTITASNDFSTDTETLVITINPKDPAGPTITNGTFNVTVLDAVFNNPVFDVEATGGAAPLVFTASNLPQGLVINPNTGVISGATSQLGTYDALLLVNDVNSRSDARVLTITVDQVPPVIDTTNLNISTPVGSSFFYTIATTSGSQPMTYTAALQAGGLPQGLALAGANIAGTPTLEGFYPITISATNQAGTDTEVLNLTVTRVPDITSATTATGIVGAPFAYTFTGVGFPAPVLTLAAGDAAALATFGLSFNGSTITGTPSQPGTVSVTATSTNIVGVDTQQLTITISNVTITSPLLASGVVNQAFSYTITATGGANVFTATNLPAGLTLSGATISGTPFAAGQTQVPISASNGIGTVNATLVIAISTSPNAPAISSPLSVDGVLGIPFLYKIDATNTPTSFGATPLPPGLSVSTDGFITGSPSMVGSFNVTISATNASGTGTASLVIAIASSTGAPAITSPLTATAVQGNPFSFTVTSIGQNLTFAASFPAALGTQLSINPTTGVISGTPLIASTPTFAITLNVTNPNGTANATLVLTVLSQSPQINSLLSVGSPVGSPFSYTITATGSLPITYGLTGTLPSGLTFNPATATISGTPTVEGVSTVTITASNAFPPPDSETLTITVGPRAPIITSATTANGQTNVPFTYQTVATGSVPMTFSAAGLPPGLTINGTNGLISGTPTTVGVFNTTITATNSVGSDNETVEITIIEALDDFDLDGFPNELEIALGTNPNDPNSTPFGGKAAPARNVLSLNSVKIKLNFAKPLKDSVTQKGTLQLPAGYVPGGKTCTVVVGGLRVDFGALIVKKNSAAIGTNKVSIKPGRNNAPAKYSLTIKGSLASNFLDEGLTNETIDKRLNATRNVRTFVLLDALGDSPLLYEGNKQLLYTAKAGKTGSASGK